jgi:alpha-tubulin suppressor-like RCC1 family protein
MSKRGISAVIANVILIALVMVLLVVVWVVVKNLISENLESSESCLGTLGKVEIEPLYTYYDSDLGELQFSINIGSVDVDGVLVSISVEGETKGYTLTNELQSIEGLSSYSGESRVKLPGKNAGLTYIAKGFSNKPDSIKISPIVNGHQCEPCDNLYGIEGGKVSSCIPDCANPSTINCGNTIIDQNGCGSCPSGIYCSVSGETCIGGYCVSDSQTCEVKGGDICEENEYCPGEILNANDSEECCSETCEGTLEPNCGTRECGPAPNGCGGNYACGTCLEGECIQGVCFKRESISAGDFHTCGIRASDSKVLCWGRGNYGQLGNGGTADKLNPTLTSDTSAYLSVTAGSYHTCGIRSDSKVLCWGRGNYGQLGNGGTADKLNPTLTSDTSAYLSITAGSYHTCGIRSDSKVLCWGNGLYGRLGNGVTDNKFTPTSISDTSAYLSITAGNVHTCGIRSDSKVLCWGRGSSGQLGNGVTADKLNPTLTSDTSAYLSITAGNVHTCGIRESNSRVLCWGNGLYGRLGNGGTADKLNPTLTSDTNAYLSVTAGSYHTCGIRSDSRVLCWGFGNYGQLGNGVTDNKFTPTSISDTSAYLSVTAGSYHTCGIRSDSRVLCWGEGSSGQLGNGGIGNKLNPTLISGSETYG